MFCHQCGAENPDVALFCVRCGTKTTQPQSASASVATDADEQETPRASGGETPPPSQHKTPLPGGGNSLMKSIGNWKTIGSAGAGLREGDELGSFRIEQQLGRGGMGVVWKAHDQLGDRHVVIKVLPPELQSNQEEMDRVRQTFQKIHALQHQHICPTYQIGQDARVGWFLVMKFIEA